MEVALEVDPLARQQQPQQCEFLAHAGQRTAVVLGAVPSLDDGGGGHADAEQHIDVGMQRLERGRSHRRHTRGAQLGGQHPGSQSEAGLGRPDGGERGERLETGGLRHPERAVALGGRPTRGIETGAGPEAGERGEGEPRWEGAGVRAGGHGADASGHPGADRSGPSGVAGDRSTGMTSGTHTCGSTMRCSTTREPRNLTEHRSDMTGTGVTESEIVPATSATDEAVAIIDRALSEMLHRELVSTGEVSDLLLDLRSLLVAEGATKVLVES